MEEDDSPQQKFRKVEKPTLQGEVMFGCFPVAAIKAQTLVAFVELASVMDVSTVVHMASFLPLDMTTAQKHLGKKRHELSACIDTIASSIPVRQIIWNDWQISSNRSSMVPKDFALITKIVAWNLASAQTRRILRDTYATWDPAVTLIFPDDWWKEIVALNPHFPHTITYGNRTGTSVATCQSPKHVMWDLFEMIKEFFLGPKDQTNAYERIFDETYSLSLRHASSNFVLSSLALLRCVEQEEARRSVSLRSLLDKQSKARAKAYAKRAKASSNDAWIFFIGGSS